MSKNVVPKFESGAREDESLPGSIVRRMSSAISQYDVQISWSCQQRDMYGTFKMTIYNSFGHIYDGLVSEMNVFAYGTRLELTDQERELLIVSSIMDM